MDALKIIREAEHTGLRWGRPDGVPVTREAVVAEARSWIGTPWVHQHDTKGVGVDCGGLTRGVSVTLGLIPAGYRELMPQVLRGYGRHPEGDLGQRLCDFYLRRISLAEMRPADVVLMRFEEHAQHSAFLADYRHGGLSMIHSLLGAGVREHRLDETWRRRIVAAYSIPGVE